MANFVPQLNNINAPQTVSGPTQSILPSSNNSASSIGSGLLGTLGNVLNGIPIIGGLLGSISQGIQNWQNRKFEAEQASEQRAWNEQMMDKQNAFSLDMWNKTNEYNSPLEQVKRMHEAGLNPLYYGLDGSSANGMQSAQALGYDRASVGNQINPFSVGSETAMQVKSLQKDIQLKNAQIDSINANTEGTKLDNEWKDKTMDARTEAETLKNSLTKENIAQVKSVIAKNEQEVKESIARTESERERKSLIIAQKMLAKAQADEIVELLPYKKLLTQAQTLAQKASAAASFANAAYQQGLLDSGYIDALVDQAMSAAGLSKANTRNQEAMAAVNAWKAAIKNGNTFAIDDNDFWVERQGKNFLNALFQDLSIIGEAVTGPLAGIFK